MESCTCGVERKQYWLWQDAKGGVHASRFVPTTGVIGSVLAATSRDALLAGTGTKVPRHTVTDIDHPDKVWEGRCSALSVAV